MDSATLIRCLRAQAGQPKTNPTEACDLVDEWFSVNGSDDLALVAVAKAIAEAYIHLELPFDWANKAVWWLMTKRNWEAPKPFWHIFVAFEDMETIDNIGQEGIEHVQDAIVNMHT